MLSWSTTWNSTSGVVVSVKSTLSKSDTILKLLVVPDVTKLLGITKLSLTNWFKDLTVPDVLVS